MNYQNLFKKVIDDRTSGSLALLDMTVSILKNHVSEEFEINAMQLKSSINDIKKKQPDFPALHHFLDFIIGCLHDFPKQGETTLKSYLLKNIENYEAEWKDAPTRASRNLLKTVNMNNKTILLHSNSNTIIELFSLLSSDKTQATIYQTSSEPLKEGKIQAMKLSELGFEVHFIQEASCSRFIKYIDFAIFGADAIFKNAFINKSGSFQLALLFKFFNKPVYVIADARKKKPLITDNNILNENERDVAEIWGNAPQKVKIHNYYFELIPNELVDRFFL